MQTERDTAPQLGRQVQLVPVEPGVWLALLGVGVMVLGPLFGFLTGTVLGTDGHILGTSPLFFFLFLGFIVAGVGLGIVLLGVRRILRHRRTDAVSAAGTGGSKTATEPAATPPDTSERSTGGNLDT